MNYHEILLQSSNMVHHIDRYVKFIVSRPIRENKKLLHLHHILPKAKDMYPQYRNLKQNKWNGILLTYREHYIAHRMLSKIFPNSSQSIAILHMINMGDHTISSKEYQRLMQIQYAHLLGNTHKLGKKESLETRRRKSEAHKGLIPPFQYKKGNKSRTGMVASLETRQKRSKSLMGNKNALGSKGHSANKGRIYYYNPILKKRKRLKPGADIPEGYLPGCGPCYFDAGT